MVEKIKKTIPWLLIFVLISMATGVSFNFWRPEVSAGEKEVSTSVTIENSAPSWVGVPIEDPISTAGSPTKAGSDVTFKGKANDPNDENYFLIICKTAGYTTTSDGTYPSCDGGDEDTWATSTATTDNTTSTITYTTQDGDAESNAWYAYVCDVNVGDQLCSSVSQGTGDSGSPFIVNHRPSFTIVSNTSPQNPGDSVTWNTTSSESDIEGGSDTVKLMICKDDSGITNDECNSGISNTWCTSTYSGSDASCAYSIPIPTDDESSPYAAYAYIVDNHYFAAAGVQASSSPYIVNNVAPVISSVKLNGDENINLIEGNTTSTQITGIISDNNGDADIITATAKAYRSGVGAGACTSQNDNQCYYNISCSLETADADTSRNATCTVSIWYHADPTGDLTPWSAETWLATLEGEDNNAATGSDEIGYPVEMIPMSALDVSNEDIGYGTLGVGEKRDVNVTSTIFATGNCALDTNLSGTDMTGAAGTIAAAEQKYATTSGEYDTTGTALSTGAVEFELELAKTTDHASTSTDDIYWGLNIPLGKPSGAYSGLNTFGAVIDELIWP